LKSNSKETKVNCIFRAKTFTPQEVNASCFGCPCSSLLESKGASGTRGLFPQEIFALQRQAEKFSVSPFTKGDDLRRFLKAAVRGGKEPFTQREPGQPRSW
jgi:hypothetical protein